MFKAIGRYGEWNRYEMELGESPTIEHLTKGVVNRLNSIRSEEKIRISVYNDDLLVGRIVDYRELGDYDPNIPMVYLNNEEYDKWAESRRNLYLGIR